MTKQFRYAALGGARGTAGNSVGQLWQAQQRVVPDIVGTRLAQTQQ